MAENSTGSFLTSSAPGKQSSDLLTMLAQEYGKPLTGEVVTFLGFARGYLEKNRPSEIITLPNNVGLKLTNFVEVRVFPDQPGMQVGDGSMASNDPGISINRP